MATQYQFDDATPKHGTHRKHRRGGQKSKGHTRNISDLTDRTSQTNDRGAGESTGGGNDVDPTDGSGSLTYSASSSVNGSSAGESTDSSFADIMRVLDLDDSSELAAIMAKEGVSNADAMLMQQRTTSRRNRTGQTGASVTSSLNYSEDGESSISGEGGMPTQTTSGQPSDSGGPDGGGMGGNIMFQAPSMPEDGGGRSSRGGSKSRTPKAGNASSLQRGGGKPRKNVMPPSKTERQSSLDDRSSSGSAATPTSPPPRAMPSKKSRSKGEKITDPDSEKVWYAQWWMCGFTDALGRG